MIERLIAKELPENDELGNQERHQVISSIVPYKSRLSARRETEPQEKLKSNLVTDRSKTPKQKRVAFKTEYAPKRTQSIYNGNQPMQ
jgi:hypothetical protein